MQGGKFEKPQLKKIVKKTTDKPKNATTGAKENEDGVNTVPLL